MVEGYLGLDLARVDVLLDRRIAKMGRRAMSERAGNGISDMLTEAGWLLVIPLDQLRWMFSDAGHDFMMSV